jgi:hypothetical protein
VNSRAPGLSPRSSGGSPHVERPFGDHAATERRRRSCSRAGANAALSELEPPRRLCPDLQPTPHSGTGSARASTPELCALQAASRVRIQLRTLQRGENCICCSMAMSLDRKAGIMSVRVCKRATTRSRHSYLAGLLLLAACAQSPTSDAVFNTGSSDPTSEDSGSSVDNSEPSESTDDDGTNGGASAHNPGSSAGTAPANARSDAGVDAGLPKDAGTSAPSTGGSATIKDAGAPASGATTKDAGTSSSGETAHDAGTSGSSTGGGTGNDAGASTGGGTTPTGGTAAQCASTPSYPTANACAQCICAKCGSQVAACYASSDATKNTQCGQVQACAETKHCTGQDCYCGSSLFCAAPNGGCVDIIKSAAGSSNLIDINNASTDTATSVGRANAIGNCSKSSCKTECGL